MCSRSFDRAVEEWGRFHCDLKEFSQWLTDAETLLSEGPDGQLDLESARQQQAVSTLYLPFTAEFVFINSNLLKAFMCEVKTARYGWIQTIIACHFLGRKKMGSTS